MANNSETHMRREICEIPDVTRRLLNDGRADIEAAAAQLRDHDPEMLITVARGSSDHAATYFKYACELLLGVPVASVGPSISSIYGAKLRLPRSASIGISQSGKSPDIVSMCRSTKEQGALAFAITNDPRSPLAEESNVTLPIHAGPEKSVAATKTFVATIVAELALLAHWSRDTGLLSALNALPAHFERALNHDWPDLRAALCNKNALFTIGRGPAYAIALEAALKFKETCQIQAEAYSSAEILHGPVSVIGPDYPVLALVARDAGEDSIVETCDDLSKQGADVFATSKRVRHSRQLGFEASTHPLTDPLVLVVSFYAFIEKLAKERGINPDTPRNLQKVTKTV